MSPVLQSVVTVAGGMAAGLAVAGGLLWHQQQALTRARYDATHDATTGLPNRRAALVGLDRAIRAGAPFGVILLDLDDFKTVNDTFGHEAGNQVLGEVAARLAALPHPVVLAARLSGDEFVLLADGHHDRVVAAARTAWQTIHATPVPLGAERVPVHASVGYTCARLGLTARQLLSQADEAMYQAKATGAGVCGHRRSTADRHLPPAERCRDRRHPSSRRRGRQRPPRRPPHAKGLSPAMATDLYFDLAEALRLAEHAVAAPQHNPNFTEHTEGRACPGALEWVADWGTYLMSGGRPGLHVKPDDPDSGHVVVYAEAGTATATGPRWRPPPSAATTSLNTCT